MSSTYGETAAWLETLYGQCTRDDGEIVLVHPTKKRLESCHMIGSGYALVAAAKAMDGKCGYYLKINPMNADAMRERSRREGKGINIVGKADEVKTIVSFHLDCDAGKSSKYHSRNAMLRILGRMPHKPTLIVNSDGSDGGFHAYWILDKPHRITDDEDRERIKAAAKRWEQRLNTLADGKLDATANIDRVLRVVGQRRQNGNLVYAHDYEPRRVYTLDQLTLPEPKPKSTGLKLPPVQTPRRDGESDRDHAWRAMTEVQVNAGENDGSGRVMRYCAIAKANNLDERDAVAFISKLLDRTPGLKKRWTNADIKKRFEDAR
ncbi:MAG: hypothetical protein F9B45_30715 [Phycisphaera sp. RhM]|nr:hypothetical protein [Phycisphaera sp. RhM]